MKFLDKINGNKTLYCSLILLLLQSDINPIGEPWTDFLIKLFMLLGGISGGHKLQKAFKNKKK